MAPLPHAALISAWLGGHGVLHSYFPIAGNALPDSSASSNLSFLSQSDLSSVLSITMAPNRMEKGKKPLSSANPPPAVEPAIGRSRVLNREAMDKVRLALATSLNEWGGTVAWPASRASVDRTATEVQFFIDALWAGLVPPFSALFNAVLSHY